MSDNIKPKTKRQHYVPVFLLKHFCDADEKLTVYNKCKQKVFSACPKDICFEKYLYEPMLEDDYFSAPNAIEKNFATKEGEWSRLLERIIKICDNPQNCNAFIATANEKHQLAEFFYNIIARNPYSMKIMQEYLEQMGEHDIFGILADHGFGTRTHMCKRYDLYLAFQNSKFQNDFCGDLEKCYFYVGVSENESLCISDCPFCISVGERLFGFIPITPKYILIWSDRIIGNRANCMLQLNKNASLNLKNYYMNFKGSSLIISNGKDMKG